MKASTDRHMKKCLEWYQKSEKKQNQQLVNLSGSNCSHLSNNPKKNRPQMHMNKVWWNKEKNEPNAGRPEF